MDRIFLRQEDIPKKWYNVLADLKLQLDPPISPKSGGIVSFDELAKLFPPELIDQETTTKRWIEIPKEILDILSLWRPTPLIRAKNLEKALETPARIYFKHEGLSPTGSHKPNTAVAQVYYNKIHGIKRLTTETGAGQWGSALAFSCKKFGLDCRVFMVKVSYQQKTYRRIFMNIFGAEVIPSPSNTTEAGRAILERHPNSNGSLGIAIGEAVEEALNRDDTNYALGSVLNHVILHQSIIGIEAKKQFDLIGDYPDIIFGCCGGGSNFAGIAFPFLQDKLDGRKIDMIAVEPASCPTLTKGKFCYDYGDTAKLTPIIKMYTLGHDFEPPAIHAGGLRYHGVSPIVSKLYNEGIVDAINVNQLKIFKSAILFAECEGIIPAPESAHAIAAAIDEALRCREGEESKAILFSLSGHGLLIYLHMIYI